VDQIEIAIRLVVLHDDNACEDASEVPSQRESDSLSHSRSIAPLVVQNAVRRRRVASGSDADLVMRRIDRLVRDSFAAGKSCLRGPQLRIDGQVGLTGSDGGQHSYEDSADKKDARDRHESQA
jgi:hypothetical protein